MTGNVGIALPPSGMARRGRGMAAIGAGSKGLESAALLTCRPLPERSPSYPIT